MLWYPSLTRRGAGSTGLCGEPIKAREHLESLLKLEGVPKKNKAKVYQALEECCGLETAPEAIARHKVHPVP